MEEINTTNINAGTIDDLSVSYYDNDVEVIKELGKVILTKGAWATIIYKYQEWVPKLQAYGPIKFTIRRYQKNHGIYKNRSKFNISSIEQAKKIIEVLQDWI